MVVHLLAPETGRTRAEAQGGPRVGLVVSKAVGPAVTRNKVARRLRHLARERTGRLPLHGMLVVRALPPAAHASYDELAAELDRCLMKLGVSADRAAIAEVGR
jgi:ribonuclease P protein component